ncbi:MAG TPA: glycerophosphodiester phosphodiesterase [Mobilitalea sp.]|nr:glycerophosphodiester phosphodiesterase [Mobilitalea sp.]
MKKTARKLNYNSKIIFLIDLYLNLLILLFIIPLFNYAIKFSMKITRQSYITQENLTKFLLSPSSILLLLLGIIVVPILIQWKLNTLVIYCEMESRYRKTYFKKILFYGLIKTIHAIRKHRITMLFSSVIFYLFTLLPVFIGVLIFSDLGPSFTPEREIITKILLILILLYTSLLFIRCAFIFHFGMMESISLKEAYRRSKALFMKHPFKIMKSYYSINLSLTIVFFIFYYLLLILTCLSVYLFSNKALAISVFLSAYPRINIYATLLYSMITFEVNLNLITSLFHTYHEEALPEATLQLPKIKPGHIYFANIVLLLLVIAAIFNFYLIIQNDALLLGNAISGIEISSHRGNSHISPENTIPALENAIRANSDYAEIDVQETKDGVLVLLHDSNLYRTSGVNRYIWDMTAEEVGKLDVGSWFGNEFTDTRIPTLEEALVLCKGKIKLNIEIKSSKYAPEIEEKLALLIEQYDYINQCVVSSMDYTALVKIKKMNDEIKTGYIMSAVYGNLYDKKYVDFYSIRSRYITKKIIESAHQQGKAVHAWTVNSSQELERLKSIGIDCVITDDPINAREVLYRDDTNDSVIQLINRMFRSRSLYTFLHY